MARQLNRRFCLYALGGGRGHVTRASALGCALEARGATARLLIPKEQSALARQSGVREWIPLEPAPPADLRARVETALHDFDATDWVVDSFPEGIGGELVEPILGRARSVALLRLRRDARSSRFAEAIRRYDCCFDLEPHLEWLPEDSGAHPFGAVTRDVGDSPEPSGRPSPDVLLVASETSQRAFLTRLAQHLRSAGVDVTLVCSPDPSAAERPLGARELGARVVVGPGGYNLTYELVQTRAWHLALPVPRRYDDQRRRAEQVALAPSSPEAVERSVLALLEHAGPRPPRCPVWPMDRLAEHLLESD